MSELQGLQLSLEEFRANGAEVMAISVDSVARNRQVAGWLDLSFPILSDPERSACRAFGVIHEHGGIGGEDVARPATFILDDGVVVWRDLTENWRIRPKPRQLLDQLRAVP